MPSIIDYIEIGIYLIQQDYLLFWWFLYALAHVVYVYYFYQNGCNFPYASALPLARVWYYRNLSGISLYLVILYCLFTVVAYFLPSLVFYAGWLICAFLVEFKYAQTNTDTNPVLYALVPPYKLYYLYKEAKALAE